MGIRREETDDENACRRGPGDHQLFATTTPEQMLELGKAAGVTAVAPRPVGQGKGRRKV